MTVTVAAVTGAAPPAALLTPGGAPADRPLLAAALAALPAARDRAALLLPPLPRLAAPGRRRMAEAVLEDAAATGGGFLLRAAAGGTLLLGTSPAAAGRAAAALAALAGTAALPVWHLPAGAEAVLAWATGQAPAPSPVAARSHPGPAALQPALDALTAEAVLRADRLVAPAGEARGRRLRLSRAAIAAALGPLAADPDLLAHAGERMAARLLPGLAAWAAEGTGLRLVPLPRDRLPVAAAAPGAVGVLPLAVAADPDLAAHRRRLAERGWGLALAGIEAASLPLLDPVRPPADLLLVRWSPALAEPGPLAALRRLDPARLVLTGAWTTGWAEAAEARDFARRSGLAMARPA